MIRVDKNSEYDIFAGRPSVYSNPFTIGKDGTRDLVIKKFERYIRAYPKLNELLDALENKRVACWCKINQRCHLDIFIKLIMERKQISLLTNINE